MSPAVESEFSQKAASQLCHGNADGRHGAGPASMTARYRFDSGSATPRAEGAECGVTADEPLRALASRAAGLRGNEQP